MQTVKTESKEQKTTPMAAANTEGDKAEERETLSDKYGKDVLYKVNYREHKITAHRINTDEEIGVLETFEIKNEEKGLAKGIWLKRINVIKSEQRKRIGALMLGLAYHKRNLDFIACIEDGPAEYRLSIDAQNLIAYCLQEKFIFPNACIFPIDSSNTHGYRDSILIKRKLVELKCGGEMHADKNGEQIGYEIDVNHGSISAYRMSTAKKIGSLKVLAASDADPDDPLPKGTWLDKIGVHENEQRKGIGAKMLELAVKKRMFNSIACVRAGQEQTANRLTPEGEALVASCVRKKIIPRRYCKFPEGYEKCGLILNALNELTASVIDNSVASSSEGSNATHARPSDPVDVATRGRAAIIGVSGNFTNKRRGSSTAEDNTSALKKAKDASSPITSSSPPTTLTSPLSSSSSFFGSATGGLTSLSSSPTSSISSLPSTSVGATHETTTNLPAPAGSSALTPEKK